MTPLTLDVRNTLEVSKKIGIRYSLRDAVSGDTIDGRSLSPTEMQAFHAFRGGSLGDLHVQVKVCLYL